PVETPDGAQARARSLPAPVTDVAKLCVCDLLVAQCDTNCCCDPDCGAEDFSLFTACSVPVVTGDSQLCSQKAAVYSLDVEANPPERIFKLIDQVNPSIFCIHATNYKQALYLKSPEIPTPENFDRLLDKFGGSTFSAEPDSWNLDTDAQNPPDTNETYRYEYGAPVHTEDAFLRLPSPVVSSWCSDANPAGFLVNQATKCIRSVSVEKCDSIQALSMLFYINSSILASAFQVNITVQSIVVQSQNGMRTLLNSSDVLRLPMVLDGLCINAVLGVNYHITHTDTGEIIEAAAAFVLGAISKETLSIEQSFEISFTQENTQPVPLSGNPGYVVGLPVRAGFRPQGYPFPAAFSSSNKHSQLTILQSTSTQDCLAAQGARAPVLFGYNMISGCKLRITAAMKCQPLAQTLLDVLKGQSFPEYVASFGNSQAQDVLDWVPITQLHISEQMISNPLQSSCQIPVSLGIEVKWTKYGSLVNPQARIVNVTATITTSTLKQLPSGRERIIPVTSSVVFTDISSPAEPGYKAWPTINIKLPFDFFYPFV
ncbi:TECT1 protein, partial [Pteruthius melanotis]|nr:TECT1 protein [Pteruthius melanotis]